MMHKCRDTNLSYLEAALRRGASKGDDEATTLIQQKQKDDTVGANVAMGLKPQQLTKQEQPLFSSRSASYLRVREKILLKWCQDCKHPVDLQELLDDADDRSLSVTKDAYHFLQENGYINFGVLQEFEPKAQVATMEQPREQQQKTDSDNSEAAIVFKLYELLRAADMETTSEKALRKELQKHFTTDISTKKALVKEHVNYFIQHLEQKDTLKPKGYEELTHSDKAADTANTMPRKQAAAKAAAKAKREVAAAPRPKPAGRVVVVGAGPAGLAAATLLQRVGVDVVVLEARDRVGGRVHSYKGNFDAPVELGASLITSTQAETLEGLALDPLGVVCKQLGMQLHQLKAVLPLHYATGCKDTDVNVDELRDQLLNCALNAADEAGAAKQSLEQALQQALEQRLRAAAATSSCCDSPSSAAAADTHQAHQDNDATQPQQHHQTLAADPRAQQQQQQGRQLCRLEPTQEITHKAETKPVLPPGLDLTSDTDKKPTYGDLVAAAAAGAKPITADMLDVLDWHWAYLEYICGVSLYEVSLALGEQGSDWGRFGGRHSMVVGGFDKAMQGLAKQLGGNLHLSTPVNRIEYPVSASEQQQQLEQAQEGAPQHESDLQQRQSQQQAELARVTTAAGEVYECSAVLVTLPLGVLKAGGVEFAPPLPDWKVSAVQALGFGDLNKVVLQFPTVFWEDKDSFGIAQPAGAATRGRCFMFWSLARCTGVPLLSALVSGQAARAAEDTPLEDMVQHVMQALRCVYGEAVPEPVASYATRWGSDEFSRGSYSYVAVGSSGAEYDVLAAPVASRVLFAGEHTCKEHPGSVQGAMLSGMREAARALHLLRGTSAAIDDLGRTGTSSRADVEGEEEECEVASEADDAAEEQRVTKQTSGKKREKKAKQQKLNKKQKAGAGAEGFDDEDLKHGGQRGARERRPAGITPAEMQSQLQQRQHLQNHLNRLWKGFIDAQTGDAHTVLDVLNNCSSLEERQQCVAAVMRAPAEAVQNLSEHAKFLEVIFSWLEELLPERSDANLHVTKKLLELLAKLTSSWAAITAVPQFMKVLKAASEHRNKEVAQMGAAVRRSWMSRNPSKPTQESTPRRPSSAAQGSAASQAVQQKQQHCPSSSPASSVSAHALAAAAATGAGDVGGADKLADLVDADSLQELEQAQAALQAAKEQAAHEAALLAAMQQEPLLPNSGRMRFDTFGEYTRVTKRQQQDAKDEAMEQQVPYKRSKHQRDGHHWQHHQQQRKQESAAADEKQQPGSGIGADANDAGVKELRDFIKSRLKPRFQSKELDQEGCKWVLRRVQEKVLKNTTALEVVEGGFLTGKRAKKVADLVDSYIDRRKADVSKELKLAAVKAAPAPAAGVKAVMPVTTAAAPPQPPTRSKWDQPA